ncbi:hypothetical protein BH23BAC2_BH23BAC2_24580 [soil metagenome]
MMKNILRYYVAILIPLGLIIWLNNLDLLSSTFFPGFLFFYAFIYRTYTDGKRLFDKGLITKEDIWKGLIPGSRLKYFKDLYLQ